MKLCNCPEIEEHLQLTNTDLHLIVQASLCENKETGNDELQIFRSTTTSPLLPPTLKTFNNQWPSNSPPLSPLSASTARFRCDSGIGLHDVDDFEEIMIDKLHAMNEEITSLRAQVTNLEKLIQSKNAELEDRDFRLSLIENSNHDGSMIWKIPQFSQRKADAENGKYTSIFSLPFYTGRYGFKMCLRLYIMGDGIGKGTHLSLFFVVMRGEFDNILQWPFTHKVTFKLINQAGGRDIVDTFQPDPMIQSSSFRKPKSDMNIASGCPRFVSHTELERGGFIVDDTIFIKCLIDTSTIVHP